MGIFSKIFGRKKAKLIKRSDEGIALAEKYIERADKLETNIRNLRRNSAGKYSTLAGRFDQSAKLNYGRIQRAVDGAVPNVNPYNAEFNSNFENKNQDYKRILVDGYYGIHQACDPIENAVKEIKAELKDHIGFLKLQQRELDVIEERIVKLDETMKKEDQAYQKNIDEVDSIISTKEAELEKYLKRVKGLNESIEKGEKAASKIKEIDTRLDEIAKKIRKEIALDEGETIKGLKDERKEKTKERSKEESFKEAGDDAVGDKFDAKIEAAAAWKELRQAKENRTNIISEKVNKDAQRARQKEGLGANKDNIDSYIECSIERLNELKENLDQQEREYNNKEKDLNKNIKEDKKLKAPTTQQTQEEEPQTQGMEV